MQVTQQHRDMVVLPRRAAQTYDSIHQSTKYLGRLASIALSQCGLTSTNDTTRYCRVTERLTLQNLKGHNELELNVVVETQLFIVTADCGVDTDTEVACEATVWTKSGANSYFCPYLSNALTESIYFCHT